MLDRIWKDFLTIAKDEVGSRAVETWLKALSLKEWDPMTSTVSLEAPNTFICDWIEKHYLPLLQQHMGRLLHVTEPRIVVTDASRTSGTDIVPVPKAPPIFTPAVVVNEPAASKDTGGGPRLVKRRAGLNPAHRFDTFVVGPNNSLAYAAAQAVAEQPGRVYNPLFIYGGSGLGKTHLLHAIGNEIQRSGKRVSMLYQTTDRFVNEFISAIRFDKMHYFEEKYKQVDMLFLDDIQFIANKDQTQEALFYIFNALYEAQKQIVFSSDLFPRDIQGIAERFKSRLEWGMIADIQSPTHETKVAILKKKADLQSQQVTDDVLHFIAEQTTSSIRELEGAMIRVMAFASLTKQAITLDLAKKVLVRSHVATAAVVDFKTIAHSVCRHYSYTLDDLRSQSRAQELALVRQITMYLMKDMTGKSLREIGLFLKRKDHSTVLHAINKIDEYLRKDKKLRQTIDQIKETMV